MPKRPQAPTYMWTNLQGGSLSFLSCMMYHLSCGTRPFIYQFLILFLSSLTSAEPAEKQFVYLCKEIPPPQFPSPITYRDIHDTPSPIRISGTARSAVMVIPLPVSEGPATINMPTAITRCSPNKRLLPQTAYVPSNLRGI